MTKIKYLLLFVCVAGCLTACKKNDGGEAQYKADTAAIRNYINANNIPAIKDSTYGFFYQILNPGTGNIDYTVVSRSVTVNYTGRLLNSSTLFDDTNGTPVTFELNSVITGWRIGIPLIQKGGKIRLFIPSIYGYQNVANGPIPPNSILDFTIDLVDVK